LLVYRGNRERMAIVTDEVVAELQAGNARLEAASFAEAGHNVRREAFDGLASAVMGFLHRGQGIVRQIRRS
jgi:hypothetical protein